MLEDSSEVSSLPPPYMRFWDSNSGKEPSCHPIVWSFWDKVSKFFCYSFSKHWTYGCVPDCSGSTLFNFFFVTYCWEFQWTKLYNGWMMNINNALYNTTKSACFQYFMFVLASPTSILYPHTIRFISAITTFISIKEYNFLSPLNRTCYLLFSKNLKRMISKQKLLPKILF